LLWQYAGFLEGLSAQADGSLSHRSKSRQGQDNKQEANQDKPADCWNVSKNSTPEHGLKKLDMACLDKGRLSLDSTWTLDMDDKMDYEQ